MSNCENCANYVYDEYYECYTCDMDLDEDEMDFAVDILKTAVLEAERRFL